MIFNKDLITNSEFDWFKKKLDDGFNIPNDNKSKVIFGFNGVGKTTMFNCIKDLNNDSFEYLEYLDLRNQLIKNKKKLTISPNIIHIENLRQQIDNLKSKINLKNNLKTNFGIGNFGQAKDLGTKIISAQKDGTFNGFTTRKTQIEEIVNKLGDVPSNVFISLLHDISSVETASEELSNARDHVLFNALNALDSIIDNDDMICPVCDNNKPSLKETIKYKMNNLNNKKSILVKKLKANNINFNETIINNLISANRMISSNSELKQDYLLCNGDTNVYDELSKNFTETQAISSQLKSLESEAKRSYNNIIRNKYSLESDLKKYFDVDIKSSIEYDSVNYRINIEFPREIKTYSTGEINLISFLYRVYSFIGSNKTILVLDDPVSSLDLINHYKIAYEIVKNTENTKSLIILTHSVEFINVINSQHPSNQQFDYYYLEQLNSIIYIKQIQIRSNNSNPNIISLDKLSDNIEFPGFIDALIQREQDPTNASIQLLFHYTVESLHYLEDSKRFSNHDFVSLIDEFTSFIDSDFYRDSYLKILYLTALRVWIEEKLYKLISNENTSLQQKFLSKNTLNEKINCILPRKGSPSVIIPEKLTRDDLMSKKVMLNQGVHYYSQIMPFSYAINLSFDSLKEEILHLKEIFSSN